ncbi:hypothetical protein FH972_002813 [Carpinus fangiana]|uniref:Uncharacterized protein n=1 Tax=Carpinus fangiana TaxID=176857 RepID=A0A5N6QIE7_9ROSI|nr:hypothetical protein FH972_002813 [Carpinus fangiana]
MLMAVYGAIVSIASLLDLGVKYLGPLLADTNKQVLEIHESVFRQELEMRSLGEQMK